MTIWNQIVNAVYRDEWQLVEAAVRHLPGVQLDDATDMAEVVGNVVAERLYADNGDCLQETVAWLLKQPYINRQHFAEWVAMDALKRDDALHKRTYAQVAPHCGAERILEIKQHLAEFKLARRQFTEPAHATPSWSCTVM